MSPRFTTLAASFLCAATLHAEDAATNGVVPPYKLQRKSGFTAPAEGQRAPFWPIGWVKRKSGPIVQETVPVGPKVTLDPKAFKVSSILLGNPSLAIINGRTYSEGETLRQPRAAGGVPTVATVPIPPGARIRVYRIDDGEVTLQHDAQLVTVMLQRPELNGKRADEELLLEDRP